jgi:uncharacterized membrane protein YgcG
LALSLIDSGDEDSAAEDPLRSIGVLANLASLWDEVFELVCDRLSLAALETRLAGESLVTMVVTGVMIAVLLVSAWFGLVASAIMVLIDSGVIAYLSILIGVGANVLVALMLYTVVRRKSRNLQWAGSIRSLESASGAGTSSGSPNASR